METPYGEIPDRLAVHMGPQEMHDFLRRSRGRRSVLKGAAALGAAAIAGPVLWRQSAAIAADEPPGPQWLAFGADPVSQMYLSWSAGRAAGGAGTPRAPQVRWGTDASYGSRQGAGARQVPVPAAAGGEPPERTFYNRTLLAGLAAGTTYHYSVSNDGVSWSPDATFATAHSGAAGFRFTAFGDEAISPARAAPMARLVAALRPAFHLVAGDLAYATPNGMLLPQIAGFIPGRWDDYLQIIGPSAAQSIPWQAAVGAHETEPLGDHGYAGFVTRFPQAYDLSSGSPVVRAFRYGNAAFIQLDGNDVSAQEPVNAGYTRGRQTAWLARQLAGYRSSPGVDFIVVVCNCCCYSSNRTHGSDGGLRDAWGPLFDRYQVDLVISGHVHAYERTNPMRAGQPTRQVASGGTVNPVADGTTYVCVGGGGNTLYTSWYGSTDAGAAGDATTPKVWRRPDGDPATGTGGRRRDEPDTATGFSAFRRSVFCCLSVEVTAAAPGTPASMRVGAVVPAQTLHAVTSITAPAVIDSVTLTREPASSPAPWLIGAGGAAVVAGAAGAAAYVIRQRGGRAAVAAGQDAAGGAADLAVPEYADAGFVRPVFDRYRTAPPDAPLPAGTWAGTDAPGPAADGDQEAGLAGTDVPRPAADGGQDTQLAMDDPPGPAADGDPGA